MQLTFHIVMKSRSRRSSRDVNLERQSTLWNATIARCVLRRKVLLWIDGASILASTIIDLLEASNTVQQTEWISKTPLQYKSFRVDLTSSPYPSPA